MILLISGVFSSSSEYGPRFSPGLQLHAENLSFSLVCISRDIGMFEVRGMLEDPEVGYFCL